MNVHYELLNYHFDITKDKEVNAMEGITRIEIPEIKGLRETFVESIVACDGGGYPGKCSTGGICTDL